jgi:gamma-glutamyl:cysteine ligase YbdK (ATP-grasp superfamily)
MEQQRVDVMDNKNKPTMNESMFSQIDQIRQDSKDVRDFVKKVFADREFKKMSNDKEFIKYLKSIYEGTVLDEEQVKFSSRDSSGNITTTVREETINEGTDIYINNRIQITKFSGGKDGKLIQINAPKVQGSGDHIIMKIDDFKKMLKKSSNLLKQVQETINEGLKHNDMYTMLDIAAGYSSTQDQAANQMWSDEQELYDYLKSDHIPKKYHKKFYNDVRRRFKKIKE